MYKLGIFAALKHRDFRIYWTGVVTSVTGMQMFMVVQAWLVYDLTGSALQLGLLAFFRAVPSVVLGLIGGVVADKVDQRRLLIATNTGVACIYLILALLTLYDIIQVWHVLTSAFVIGGLQAFNQPSRQAIFPNLIDRKDMMSAVALNSTVHPGTRIFAPLVAGILIDYVGVPRQGAGVAILIVAFAYLAFVLMMLRVRLPQISRASTGNGLQNLLDGMKYIVVRPVFRILILTSFMNAFFGMSHVTLMPIFAEKLLGDASGSGISLLFSVAGIGGLIGAFVGGSMGSIRGKEWLIIGGTGGYGVMLIAFAFVPWYGIALMLEWIAAIFLQLFSVTAQTTLQSVVPDEFRGRVMGIWGMTHSTMQPFGGMTMGALATFLGASISVAIGGCIVAIWGFMGVGLQGDIRNISEDVAKLKTN